MDAAGPPSSDPAGREATAELAVSGMHCPSCAALVEDALLERAGVRSATVDLQSGRAVVRFDPGLLGIDELRGAVASTGYTAVPAG